MRFIGAGAVWSSDEARRFVQRQIEALEADGICQWAVELTSDRRLIGFCGICRREDDRWEIGWRFAKDTWGQGIATEAAQAALRHGLNDLGLPRVCAVAQAANLASLRVMEKIGMRFDRVEQMDGRTRRWYVIDRTA